MSVEGPGQVAVIGGTGALGFGLAVRLRQAGVAVTIGSRSSERARAASDRLAATVTGPPGTGAINAEAAIGTPVVFLAVPFVSQVETVKAVAAGLEAGQVVVDTTVPLATAAGGRATRVLSVWQGSAAQQAAELLPDGVELVSGLHTVSAASLTDPSAPLDEDVLLCGDSPRAKERVAALLAQIPGLRPIDCGRLEAARLIEQLAPLLIAINIRHKVHAGIRITGFADRH